MADRARTVWPVPNTFDAYAHALDSYFEFLKLLTIRGRDDEESQRQGRTRDAFFFGMTRTRQEVQISMKEKPMSSTSEGTLQRPTPAYTLFDASAVAVATFFGTPVVGCSLMALNYRRLGQARNAATTLILGIAVTGLAILLGWPAAPRSVIQRSTTELHPGNHGRNTKHFASRPIRQAAEGLDRQFLRSLPRVIGPGSLRRRDPGRASTTLARNPKPWKSNPAPATQTAPCPNTLRHGKTITSSANPFGRL
jgi:hypothetical protein